MMFGNIWECIKPVNLLLIIISETGYTDGIEAVGEHQGMVGLQWLEH